MAAQKSKTLRKPTSKSTKKPKSAPISSSSRRVKPAPKLSSSFRIFWSCLKLLQQNWKLFGSLVLIYGILSIILVRGLSSGVDLSSLKSALHSSSATGSNSLSDGATLFGYLIGTAGSSATPAGNTYQTLLVVLMSLVTIWSLRQVLAGKKIKAKEAFYKGVYPLIPFILVLLVLGLQLLPLVIGTWLYSTVIGSGIAVNGFEKLGWTLLFILLALWSLYMLCSSIFGLYIVALPDMTPLKALRSAKQLVKKRRLIVLRKILFLPLAIIIVGAIIMIPLIILVAPVADWLLFVLSLMVLVFAHTYMYSLYRELL